MKIRALLLGAVSATVMSFAVPAGAAMYPHGPHASSTIGGSGCTGYGIHTIQDDPSYATTARYSGSTCTKLGVRLRCRNLVGTIIDSGYTYTANGTPTAVSVYLNQCEQLVDSGHKHYATSGTIYTYTFSS